MTTQNSFLQTHNFLWPITFDLKQFHSQVENPDLKSQELDSGQPGEAYLKIQLPTSEIAENAENIVFDLKQMYSHIGYPAEEFQGQETRQWQETPYKEEIPSPEILQFDTQNTS